MSDNTDGYEVVYLTGPPASGKSTLGRLLADRVPSLKVFHYSLLLRDYIDRRRACSESLVEDDLREQSAKLIMPEDVAAVDDELIEQVTNLRHIHPVLIDSHPVTKESFGYRVTPFPMPKLRALAPTKVCMLYAESHEIIRRIEAASGGRPMVNAFQADFHTFLQAQIVSAYALELGVPLYLFDSTQDVEVAADKLAGYLKK